MITNDFHIIGYAVSDITRYEENGYTKNKLTIELEKTNGTPYELDVLVNTNNSSIDMNANYLGHIVVANGFVDGFKCKNGTVLTKLIAQNIYILDKNKTNTTARNKQQDYAPVVDANDLW